MNNYHILVQKNERRPKGEHLVTNSIKSIAEKMTKSCYSVGWYNPPRRGKASWRKTNILAFDIDEAQTLSMQQVQDNLKNIKYIISPSKSHQISKGHNPPCDRYRLLVFLKDYITDYSSYKKYAVKFSEKYGFISDKRAMDASHLFFPSKVVEFINDTGELFDFTTLNITVSEEEDFEKKDPLKRYYLSDSSIPETIQKLIDENTTRPMRQKFERFIRMLMAQTNLVGKDPAIDEFIGQGRNPLPRQTIAKFIPTTRVTLSKWFKKLIDNNLLLDLDPDNVGSERAKTYKALNELKSAIIQSYYENKAKRIDKPLPSKIDDGDWNDVLYLIAFRFQNDDGPDRYYEWVKSIKGFKDKPEREVQMTNSWKNMKKSKKNDNV
jgi:hypothetical protein